MSLGVFSKWFNLSILAIVAGLLFCSASIAGNLEKEIAWTEDQTISGKMVIDAEVVLKIAPGVKIQFANNGRLVVFGKMLALGSEQQPIIFTALDQSRDGVGWWGLRFEATGARESVMRYCQISFADVGVVGHQSTLMLEKCHLLRNRIGLQSQVGLSGSATDCLIEKNTVGVIFNQGEGFQLIGNRIENNLSAGIANDDSSPTIVGNTISNNNKIGISCHFGSNPLVENNLISGHERGIYVSRQSVPVFRHNDIIENDVGVAMEKLAFPRLEMNRVVSNRVGLFINQGGYPYLRNNNIENNREFAIELGDMQSLVGTRKFALMENSLERRQEKAANSGVRGRSESERLMPVMDQILPDPLQIRLPQEGIIDARENWWGQFDFSAATNDNLLMFSDGYDEAQVTFRGNTYPRDRIHFRPWLKAAVPNAGRFPE